MASINAVELLGHIGREPELRYTSDGTPVANVSLATTDTWKDKTSGELQESTEWHRVVFYGPMAETVNKYLTTGSQILVKGALRTREWDKDGVTHRSTEIRAKELIMLGGKRKEGGAKGGATKGTAQEAHQALDESDLPF